MQRAGSTRTEPRLPYVAALDGVRALAVAGVVLYHAGAAWLPGGFLGVDVFFVLSGFLITSLLLTEQRTSGRIDLALFWLRRARRLLPAAFLVIGVSVLAAALLVPGDLARTRADAIASFVYANNWHQLVADQSYFAAFERPSLLQHLWSLAVEEQFYLLWPLALGACLSRLGTRRTAWLTLAAAVASAALMAILVEPGRDPSRVYYGTDTHASGLLVGALLAFAWPLGRMRMPARRSARAVLDAGGVLALAAASYRWVEQPFRRGTAQLAIRAWLDRRPPRGRLASVAGVLLVAVVCGAWVAVRDRDVQAATPALAPASSAARSAPEVLGEPVPEARPLAIGASVMLAAQPALERRMTVDAAVGRQTPDVLARVARYRKAGKLPGRVVVQIGENGPVTDDDIDALRATLRDTGRVVLVNVRIPRSWGSEVNRVLARAVRDWPAARLADWNHASARTGLLYPDSTHPTAAGQRVYSRIVDRALAG